jgi:hypothetical protein
VKILLRMGSDATGFAVSVKDFIRYLKACVIAYRIARTNGLNACYLGVESHGVCRIAVLVAFDREAWRVTDFAANVYTQGNRG